VAKWIYVLGDMEMETTEFDSEKTYAPESDAVRLSALAQPLSVSTPLAYLKFAQALIDAGVEVELAPTLAVRRDRTGRWVVINKSGPAAR
jgi:hypothetical protein